MNSVLKRVLVPGPVIVGAGPSGLAIAACLRLKNIPYLILEQESSIGSLWKFKTFDNLHLHLPKHLCQLPFMPFPHDIPTYPTKHQFIYYLENYARKFSIQPTFNQKVQSAEYDGLVGAWRVKTHEFEFFCGWLVVSTGENAEPKVPVISGISEFEGKLIHSSEYRKGFEFTRKKVLVLGCGNSGMELSLDLCKCGAQVCLVIRDKLHVLPKQVFGRSILAVSMWLQKWLPLRFVDQIILLYSKFVFGDVRKIGIHRPEIGPIELKDSVGKTPVLDVGAIAKIKSGEIKVVPGLRRFTSNGVEFVDGKEENFDTVILATGYRSSVTSWLKDDNFFNKKDGYPINSFPNNWKGKNGLYSVGFTRRGLLGTSIDARKVADDIASHWSSDSRHYFN